MSRAPSSGAAPEPSASTPPGPVDLVIDAGVAIKWYVPEVHEAQAKRFLSPDFTLHVPELFYPEVGSILWKKARLLKTPEITEDEGREIVDLLLCVALTVHPMASLLMAAYDLAIGPARPTVYDSCYLILADTLNCRFVTADRKFFDTIHDGPLGSRLLWVADPI